MADIGSIVITNEDLYRMLGEIKDILVSIDATLAKRPLVVMPDSAVLPADGSETLDEPLQRRLVKANEWFGMMRRGYVQK